MSNVNLSIGGREYAVACAAGEEAHVIGLGQIIDAKIAAMGGGSHTETRALLFAALLLADEVHELKAAKGTAPSAAPSPAASPAIPPERMAAIAERLENIAAALEG